MKFSNVVVVEKQYGESLIGLRQGESPRQERKSQTSRATGLLKSFVSIAMLGAVIALLAFNYDLSEVLSDIRQLSLWTIAIIFAALFANVLAATLRFRVIAADIGHSISFRRAMASVSAGTLAGAMFFQIAGQLIARGVVMGRVGMPFANVVVITAYERIVSAAFSGLLGLAGAYYVFGSVYLDQDAGGAELVKILCGLIAATSLGALLGYRHLAVRSIGPVLTRRFTQRSLRIVGLTFLVQLPMMIAYVAASKALSGHVPILNLIAASAVVMFAASVPISFAGWGVREMSAVATLGTIGVAGHAAFTTAVLIGIGSLLAMGVTAIISLPGSAQVRLENTGAQTKSVDYSRALSWFLPLAAATLVLFQIHVPLDSTLLNINLADPIALMGGALFILNAIKQCAAPRWRVPYLNTAVVIATLVLAESLLVGGWRFGWTTWAWVNRFLGWFVLLGYSATGAFAVMENGKDALQIVLLTFVGATAAIAGIEVCLVIVRAADFQFASQLISPSQIEGFAQNRNAFALQLLMATTVVFVFARGALLRIVLVALFFAAFWFAGSRSGWIGAVLITGTSLYIGATTRREILIAALCAVSLALAVPAIYVLAHLDAQSSWSWLRSLPLPAIVPDQVSTNERIVSLLGGLKLFVENPIFGAGLGAFQNQKVLLVGGFPLVIHSTPIWLLAELGIVGFLAFVVPAVYVLFSEWRRARNDPASTVIVLCFVAFAVMSAPADMLYQRTFWLVLGAALAATPLVSHRRPANESTLHS